MVGRKLPQGQLEALVMDVLWDAPGPMVPAAVREQLSGERDLAYTTVLTILVRLWEKGALERQQVGRAHAYRPAVNREAHAARRMNELLAATSDHPGVLTRFVEALTPEQLAELRRAVGDAGDAG